MLVSSTHILFHSFKGTYSRFKMTIIHTWRYPFCETSSTLHAWN